MKFPLHLAIEYAHTKPFELDRAYKEFFGTVGPDEITNEDVKALYFEWLIFEYRQKSGTTFLTEYALRNPDQLSDTQLDQFRQIIKTHRYSEFQIISVAPRLYIEVEDIFSGTKYKVYDTLGSQNSQKKGVLKARIACVDTKWYLVGANPIYIPMVYTPRMKKILQKDFHMTHSFIKDTAEILLQREKNPPQPPKVPTKKELIAKRKDMEKLYESRVISYNVKLPFQKLIREIYEENRVNMLDFWQELTKKGLTAKFIVKEFSILQDIWNYFPHKVLNGLSPVEAYGKMRKNIK